MIPMLSRFLDTRVLLAIVLVACSATQPLPPLAPARPAETRAWTPDVIRSSTAAAEFPLVRLKRSTKPVRELSTQTRRLTKIWTGARPKRRGTGISVCRRSDGTWRMTVLSLLPMGKQTYRASDVFHYPSLKAITLAKPKTALGMVDSDFACFAYRYHVRANDLVLVDQETGDTLSLRARHKNLPTGQISIVPEHSNPVFVRLAFAGNAQPATLTFADLSIQWGPNTPPKRKPPEVEIVSQHPVRVRAPGSKTLQLPDKYGQCTGHFFGERILVFCQKPSVVKNGDGS